MRRRVRFYLNRRSALRLLLLVLALSCVVFLVVASVQIRPLLATLATARVQNTVNSVTAAAVHNAVANGEIRYDQLITLVKDHNGKVAALQSNMAEFARIQTLIVQDVLSRLSEVSSTELSIPIGTLTGSSLLAGRGPAIKIRMQSVGSSTAFFENRFTEAGINQTKHQIILNIQVKVSILLPALTTTTQVSGSYEVAETVIVGEVPDSYTYFHAGDMEQMAEDYVMNHSG